MTSNIIELYPQEPPLPPSFAAFARQQELESANAGMHHAAQLRYGAALPAVIPFHYTADTIVDSVYGYRKPVYVAKITRVSRIDLEAIVLQKLAEADARKGKRVA